jgi:hypothetical protein
LNNLAGKPNYQAIEITLREKLDTWMVLSTIICPWRQMPIAKPPIRNADRESNETAMPFSGFAPGQAWQKLESGNTYLSFQIDLLIITENQDKGFCLQRRPDCPCPFPCAPCTVWQL